MNASQNWLVLDATPGDVESLARLHVATFLETHGGPGPSFELRAQQWRDLLARTEETNFCLLAGGDDGQPAGFARGVRYTGGLAGYAGELNRFMCCVAITVAGWAGCWWGMSRDDFWRRESIRWCCLATRGTRRTDSTNGWERRGFSATRASFTGDMAGGICACWRSFNRRVRTAKSDQGRTLELGHLLRHSRPVGRA